jgi:ABC-2 type transport system ATP-binding protein
MNKNISVSCHTITKNFDSVVALKAVSFKVYEGESVALIGANGAGKTTLFNIMLGLLRSDEGACSVLGVDSVAIGAEIRARLAFVADHASPVPWASSADIARFYAALYPHWDHDRFSNLMESWNIDKFRRLIHLSKGQKRLAEIALVTAYQPDLIVLDEPFNGLDAVMRIRIQRLLRQLQQERNATIIYATHILREISSVADRMIVLRRGELVHDACITQMDESPEQAFIRLYHTELAQNPEAYL